MDNINISISIKSKCNDESELFSKKEKALYSLKSNESIEFGI